MKIIALMPVKNEDWILRVTLPSLFAVADEVIALDDRSTDQTRLILKYFGCTILDVDFGKEKVVDMSQRRMALLDEGRRRGGTHFIWLDADEEFSANFIKRAREIISKLKPGQKLVMKWVPLWKSTNYYRSNGVYGGLKKDFIVYDSPEMGFEKKFLSEGRTPGENQLGRMVTLNDDDGVVLHFQFVAWERNQMKQAWYRCSELIEGSRNAKRINNTYAVTLDDKNAKLVSTPDVWVNGLALPEYLESTSDCWQRIEIYKFFNKYGIEFFEPLQIWHIKELHDEFLLKVGREPKAEVFHPTLVYLNNIKNFLKNNIK